MEDTRTVAADGGRDSRKLRSGALGTTAIVFFVVSAAAPLTAVAGGAPLSMLLGNGPGIAGAYVMMVAILLLFTVGYTTMARHVANSGAFYAFTARGLGGVAGGAAAVIALFGYNAMQIGIYGLFGAAASTWLQTAFGLEVPWWACVYVGMAAIAVLGYRQVDLSVKVLSVLVVLEYIAVLILDAAIIGEGGDSGLSTAPFHPSTVASGSLAIALLFNFAAFIGFEATTIYAEEAKNPKRTIPRATYLSVLLIGGFYTFTTWCMVVGAGVDKVSGILAKMQDPTMFLFDLSERYVGSLLTNVMAVLFISSLFAALLAFHNAVARYIFVLGREGLLPDHLGRTHATHQSPHLGSVVQTVIAAAVILAFAVLQLDPVLALFSWLTNVGALSVMVLMVLASFSVIAYFRKHPHLEEGALRTAYAPLLAGIVMATVAGLAVANFNILTGASETLAVLLPATVPVAGLVGVVMAMKLRKAAPAVFARLGAQRAV